MMRELRWLRPAPAWLRLAVALIALALGAVTVFRPTPSLGVLAFVIGAGAAVHGVLELVSHESEGDRKPAKRIRYVLGVAWILLGVFILVWPGLTVRLLVVVVAAAL